MLISESLVLAEPELAETVKPGERDKVLTAWLKTIRLKNVQNLLIRISGKIFQGNQLHTTLLTYLH